MTKARWVEGQYNTHRLHLRANLSAVISWSSTRNDPKPYRVNVFGQSLGGRESLEVAKADAEANALLQLDEALARLRS